MRAFFLQRESSLHELSWNLYKHILALLYFKIEINSDNYKAFLNPDNNAEPAMKIKEMLAVKDPDN